MLTFRWRCSLAVKKSRRRGKMERKVKRELIKILLLLAAALFIIFLLFGEPPLAASSEEANRTELQRLEKLVAGRIEEARSLKIAEKAREVIEVLGDAKGRFSDGQFVVNYSPIELEISVSYGGKKVFVSNWRGTEEKILVYRPGEWLKEFEKLYSRAEQEKTRRKIEDLKKRYGL